MITEDYVSFEVAKLLKEKGFNEKLLTFYITDKTKKEGYFQIMAFTDDKIDNNHSDQCYLAPTLQMTRRWLMAVHNLFITFELDFSDGAYPMFDAVVYNLATCEKYPIINYDRYSYIKGTEAAIKYCLENLI